MYNPDYIGDFTTNASWSESGGEGVFSSAVDRITHSIQKAKIETAPRCAFCNPLDEHTSNCLEFYKNRLSQANEDIEELEKKLKKAFDDVDGWREIRKVADRKVCCPGAKCDIKYASAFTAGKHLQDPEDKHSGQYEVKVMYRKSKTLVKKPAPIKKKSDSDDEED